MGNIRHDSKYASTTSSIWDDLNERLFGSQIASGRISEPRARLICRICENVSYSKEVKRIKAVRYGLSYSLAKLIGLMIVVFSSGLTNRVARNV